jgi:hypothetical protein
MSNDMIDQMEADMKTLQVEKKIVETSKKNYLKDQNLTILLNYNLNI